MAVDTFLALVAFAFVTSVTLGANNFMLLASGANFDSGDLLARVMR